ncbi:probable disease resistance RPP8-like protein 2 [Salvia miltiorrhiza]|uniref:probable disease resistance RPP8-like protein 2 n=1 Tax=Salvia miltiorrhiza TaxID=226208 RepID=UPI0025ABCA8D|nr:probable disease resistance RPP8-like protein 2 [Salvia miltiorrhiza]XP_057802140.1 probable disease resistance RPP8-like protein 2 [Salvia miltiorrhiza]
MADAATEFLLNNLADLVKEHYNKIKDAKGNIEKLQRDLGLFQAFLRDTVKRRKEEDVVKNMVKEIHDIVYEIEDIIDVYVTKTVDTNHKRFLRFFKKSADLHNVATRVEGISGRVADLRAEIKLPSITQDADEKPEPRPPRLKDVVGFEDVMEELKDRLKQDTDYFDVISLIGMFGLGKTTLAWKVFNDPDISFKFTTRIWLTVSQKFTQRELFLNILKHLNGTLDERTLSKEVHELAEIVTEYLKRGRFLIVIDDVWTAEDWRKLSEALPSDNASGKVLITSRHEEVGKVASKPRRHYNLRNFKFEESWELFRLEALGTLVCPTELVDVGKIIARNCDGLPLAIVVIGGILAKSSSTNINTKRKEWDKVSKDVISYLSEKDKSQRMQKFISLSYDNLPYHLRACFLYLGLFPEDYEIPVSRLIRMWIAEGFIPQKVDTLEETGEGYLEDLISRNLVKSVKFKPDGKVKTCQIHDTLRDFCRTEAEAENFLQEIKYQSEGEFVPSVSQIKTFRRLSIHSNCLEFIQSKPFGPRVRSFVCFSKDKCVVSAENSTKITAAFTLLRVLDVLPFKYDTIDSDLYKLIHMRYIALSFKLSILPSDFNQLSNIQTLIIATESDTLDVKADIWKMKHLRHFKTNASATLKPPKSEKDCAHELQTLGLISVESCTEELPKRAPNLKKLGIRGKLSLLFETRNVSFDNLGNMKHLGKMKLVNDATQEAERLHCLPRYDRFPSGLTSLTLCATSLSWDHISTLGSLKKIEVLKLKSRAFTGDIWKVEDGGFPTLQFLHIEETDLVFWKASSRNFPKLRSLVLKNCDKLREIPIELADIPSLQMLELSTCILANKFGKMIAAAKTKTKDSEFKLAIYPPVE